MRVAHLIAEAAETNDAHDAVTGMFDFAAAESRKSGPDNLIVGSQPDHRGFVSEPLSGEVEPTMSVKSTVRMPGSKSRFCPPGRVAAPA